MALWLRLRHCLPYGLDEPLKVLRGGARGRTVSWTGSEVSSLDRGAVRVQPSVKIADAPFEFNRLRAQR